MLEKKRKVKTALVDSSVNESLLIKEVNDIRKRFGIEKITLATSMHDMVRALAS